MEKVLNKILSIIFLVSIFLIAFLSAIRKLSNLAVYIFTIIVFMVFIVLAKRGMIKFSKKTVMVIFMTAIVLRIGLFLLKYDKPLTSDYKFFYQNATNFANGQEINNRYIAIFPYLAPYVVLLGSIFKIFGSNNYLIVILLHSMIDLITSIMIYKTVENNKKGIIGATLWLINPINIIWNTICCPVVVVNCGIVCILYVFKKIRNCIEQNVNFKKVITLNIIYGMIIGIFNSFRPIMVIIIIATIIYYIYIIIKNLEEKKRNLLILIGILLIITTFYGINIISNCVISKFIKQEASTTPGWTLYLGSNLEYNGMWNEPASKEYGEVLYNEEISVEEIQKTLKEKAIQQYMDNGFKNIKLFFNKFEILTNNIVGYSNQNLIEVATVDNNLLKIIRILSEFVMSMIILLNIYAFSYLIDVQNFKNMLIYILIVLGLLSSHMLVEVSPRYVLPIIPILTIIATYSFSNIVDKTDSKLRLLQEGNFKN